MSPNQDRQNIVIESWVFYLKILKDTCVCFQGCPPNMASKEKAERRKSFQWNCSIARNNLYIFSKSRISHYTLNYTKRFCRNVQYLIIHWNYTSKQNKHLNVHLPEYLKGCPRWRVCKSGAVHLLCQPILGVFRPPSVILRHLSAYPPSPFVILRQHLPDTP